MNTSDFMYDLPERLIAQTPVEPRDSSRLMVCHREGGDIEHRIFHDIIDYLNPGDALVINETRVIPARLYGVKEETGGAIEFLLLKRIDINTWQVILKPRPQSQARRALHVRRWPAARRNTLGGRGRYAHSQVRV